MAVKDDDRIRDGVTLKVIQGDRPAGLRRAGRRQALDQCEQVTCWKCERDIGIATSRVRQAIIAPRRRPDGRLIGGTKVWVCDYCGTQIAPVK